MKPIKVVLIAALIGASGAAMAVDSRSEADREQRMNEALQNYRSGADNRSSPGTVARAEESTKRGVHKAGASVKRGAKRVGHAVETGAHKTRHALRRTGEKIKDSTTPKQ